MSNIRLTKGELSYRADFIGVLKEILRASNLEVKDEIRITLIGTQEQVLIPDLLILEKGKFEENGDSLLIKPDGLKAIIETKSPKQYSTVGFRRLIDYCEALNHDLGFATNFRDVIEYRLLPEEAKRPSIISKSFDKTHGKEKFIEISTFILSEIQKSIPEFKEISDETLIKLLQFAIDDIQNHFAGDVTPLADTLGIFQISYDKDLFSPEEQKEPQFADLVRKAAAFVILNQVIFYLALAHNTRLVGKIGKLTSLNELQSYFDHIGSAIDYRAVFGARVVSMLPSDAIVTINSLIENLETLNFYNIKREILGKIYHNLIPKKVRKRIAAYYTSNTACELLARLTIENGSDKTLDPSCGSGGFLIAAYNIKKELCPKLRHKEIIDSIYGFDISLFASHLSVINLSLQNLREATNEVYITVDDAFNQHPSETIELLWVPPGNKKVAENNGMASKSVILPIMDTVLMNPPFTRIERLEDEYQNYLIGKKGILKKYAKYVKGQSGLHCFFLLHATNFLKNKGRIGSVLPAATFSSEYGEKIEPFILTNYRISYIITYEKMSTFSVDCDFKEVLFVGVKSKEEAKSDWSAKVVILKEELIPKEIQGLAKQFELITSDVQSPKYEIRIIPKNEFKKEKNWMVFTRPLALKTFIEMLRKSKHVIEQDEIVDFHEGYHLDAPNFFRIPNDYWKIVSEGELFVTIQNTQTLVELNIPKRYLISTLDVPDLQRNVFAKMEHYILSISESDEAILPDDLKNYINWGASFKKQNDSKTPQELYKLAKYTKTHKRWYTYGAYILVRENPLTGRKIRIGSHLALIEKFRTKKRECIALFSNKPLTGPNSYFFGVLKQKTEYNLTKEKSKKLQEERIKGEKILAAWFSSSLFLTLYMYYRREISLDYGRIKIGDMQSFPCINPAELSEDTKKEIIDRFEELNHPCSQTLYEQLKSKGLLELDTALLTAIGIKEPKKALEKLYADLITELDRSENNIELETNHLG